MPRPSREIIADLRKSIKLLRFTNSRDRKMSFAKGYKKCEADLGKVPKPPKIKKVKVVREEVREVSVKIKPRAGDFNDFLANLILTRTFCYENNLSIWQFIVFIAICTLEDATIPKLSLFNMPQQRIRVVVDTLEEAGLIEMFRETWPITIIPSLKGKKLFSSFKDYYGKSGTDSQRKPD